MARFHLNFEGEHPGGCQGSLTYPPLPPTSRGYLWLDGYLEYPHAANAQYIYRHPCQLQNSNPGSMLGNFFKNFQGRDVGFTANAGYAPDEGGVKERMMGRRCWRDDWNTEAMSLCQCWCLCPFSNDSRVSLKAEYVPPAEVTLDVGSLLFERIRENHSTIGPKPLSCGVLCSRWLAWELRWSPYCRRSQGRRHSFPTEMGPLVKTAALRFHENYSAVQVRRHFVPEYKKKATQRDTTVS
ncbi:hypothetical protein TNCV_2310931 [Trichonephila clavipes]|nr:hypothetical protein TNCV_2310931 [Trichonephila clavipes]